MNRFKKAIERIQKFGWIRKNFGNEQMGFCALGAINGESVQLRARLTPLETTALQRALVAQGVIDQGDRWLDSQEIADYVVTFNDDARHSKEDVLLLLKTASEFYQEPHK